MALSEVVSAYLSLIIAIAVSTTVAAFTAITYIHSQQELLKSNIWLMTWRIAPNKVLVKNIGEIKVKINAAITTAGRIVRIDKYLDKEQTTLVETREPIAGIKACIPGTQACTYIKISYTKTVTLTPPSSKQTSKYKENTQQNKEKGENYGHNSEKNNRRSITISVVLSGSEKQGSTSEEQHTKTVTSRSKKSNVKVSNGEKTRRIKKHVTTAKHTKSNTETRINHIEPIGLLPRGLYLAEGTRESPVMLGTEYTMDNVISRIKYTVSRTLLGKFIVECRIIPINNSWW